jgi:hypothetical protein
MAVPSFGCAFELVEFGGKVVEVVGQRGDRRERVAGDVPQ